MNLTLKTDFLGCWKKYFPGAALPVALFYSDELNDVEPAKKYTGHHCIIADFVKASRGKALAFTAENMGCTGGKRYCGYSKTLHPKFEYFLSYGIEGELEGERYKKDPSTVAEFMKTNPHIENPKKYLIAKPFELLEESDTPEVILFFATPDVLAGLFTLANYDRIDLHGVKTPFGSGCSTAFLYPYFENQKPESDCILGMFDSSARPFVPKETLTFAIPFHRFETLVGYMDESFLITDTWGGMMKRMI